MWYKKLITTISNVLYRGDDKSLAQPIFRCCRTESIVPFERGVCSCAELQGLSCYRGWKEACQATRAISTTWRRELSPSFFFLQRQGAEGNSRHAHRNINFFLPVRAKDLSAPLYNTQSCTFCSVNTNEISRAYSMHSRHRIVSSKPVRRGQLRGLSIEGRTGFKCM